MLNQDYLKSVNNIPWNQRFYLKLEKEVHPFNQPHCFRPLNRAYDGKETFWSTPSPEPDLDDNFWHEVISAFPHESESNFPQNINSTFKDSHEICKAAQNLASSLLRWQPDPEKILFISILRAGVPITEWLCQMLPGSVGVALSLFVGIGIDTVSLAAIEKDFPDRTIIFVDGWTGKGGVAREIEKLGKGPLAVLVDPWGWADFAGIKEDIFCPSACFTGLATLGFSRTFFIDSDSPFSAYKFSDKFSKIDLVRRWQKSSPRYPSETSCYSGISIQQKLQRSCLCSITQSDNTRFETKKFYAETDLRIHSNEVCRALINADPQTLLFADDKCFAGEHFSLLLKLAEQRGIISEFNVHYLKDIKTKVACILSTTS